MIPQTLREGPRWLTQSQVHDPANGKEGNCTQAAIASLLGLSLAEVPDFNLIHKDEETAGPFWRHIEDWLAERGWLFQAIPNNIVWEAPYLAAGPSPRGIAHIVVMFDGAIIHDPHPSRAGLTDITATWVLLPLDPASMKKEP